MNSIGERIKQLRLARGWSLDELAEAAGGIVTKQALSKYERGLSQPSSPVVVALARAFDVRSSLLTEAEPARVELVEYRKQSKLKARDRDQVENIVKSALQDRVTLQDLLQLEIAPVPVQEFAVSTLQEVEGAAEQLRLQWNLGTNPLGNLVAVLEARGVHVIEVEAFEGFDGLSATAHDEDGNVIAAAVVMCKGVSGERQRLSIAHELGHLVLRLLDGLDAEKAAFRFAGAFLAVAAVVRRAVGEVRYSVMLGELLVLKREWGMSIQAILRRLRDLEVIGPDLYKAWCIRISASGWRKEEPEPQEPEESTWLRRTVLRALAEGLIASREASRILGETIEAQGLSPHQMKHRAFMKLPREERERILAQQVAIGRRPATA
jgi:transcriptional regulator with XRE-family HTH domain